MTDLLGLMALEVFQFLIYCGIMALLGALAYWLGFDGDRAKPADHSRPDICLEE